MISNDFRGYTLSFFCVLKSLGKGTTACINDSRTTWEANSHTATC